jgi:hypothetical protein
MAFTSKLYTVDLIWHSPDSPTGISVFYCTESSDLDSDQGYALLDKIERSDIQKASKQTLEVPNNYSVALWMIKNLRAVVNLYFRPNSPSAKCLSSWIQHFENNRINYCSLQEADQTFSTQVLYAIDRALQIYWLSCSANSDKRSVNIKILQMQGLQNNIERHNFHYIIPKVLSEKFSLKDDDSQSSKLQDRKGGKTKRDLKDIDSKL